MAKGESYEEFVNKFKPKKTTDDCYTPLETYRVIRDWAIDKYNLAGRDIVRPFYPGGDYENYNYMHGDVVIDNPPFSILADIIRFYIDRDIDFFLFAPMLTVMGYTHIDGANIVVVEGKIVYDNGARVATSFVTNMGRFKARTAPELDAALMAVSSSGAKKNMPKYQYPPNVLTAHKMASWSSCGIDYAIRRDQCCSVRRLDSQKPRKKGIYGSGLLLSESAERAAERAAENTWTLSEREREIIRKLR